MMVATRITKLAQALGDRGLDAAIFSTPVAMGYLHGLFEGAHERFMALCVRANGDCCLICPGLSAAQATRVGIQDIRPWSDGEDPMQLVKALAAQWNLGPAVIGVDEYLPAMHLLSLQDTLPAALFRSAGQVLADIRRIKDADEIAKMAAASALVDEVYLEVLPHIREGMTEVELEEILRGAMRARGGAPTFCIAAFGPGSAEPHHLNGATRLQPGQLVLMDFGCELDHYQSDITRCVAFRHSSPQMDEIYDIVFRAHMAGREILRPGTTGAEADAAAREVIAQAGYGAQFMHRLGHGIGMEGHEEPNLVSTNHEPLQGGNCFSVEPGIYLEGQFGVRIENLVTVTAAGHRSFNAEPPAKLPVV